MGPSCPGVRGRRGSGRDRRPPSPVSDGLGQQADGKSPSSLGETRPCSTRCRRLRAAPPSTCLTRRRRRRRRTVARRSIWRIIPSSSNTKRDAAVLHLGVDEPGVGLGERIPVNSKRILSCGPSERVQSGDQFLAVGARPPARPAPTVTRASVRWPERRRAPGAHGRHLPAPPGRARPASQRQARGEEGLAGSAARSCQTRSASRDGDTEEVDRRGPPATTPPTSAITDTAAHRGAGLRSPRRRWVTNSTTRTASTTVRARKGRNSLRQARYLGTRRSRAAPPS